MNRKRLSVVAHVLTAIWFVAACWSWTPHPAFPGDKAMAILVFFGTPLGFGLVSGFGWRRRSRTLAIVWPVAIVVALFVAPALGILYYADWTWLTLAYAFSARSARFLWYLSLCVLAYLAGLLVAWLSGRPGTRAADDPAGPARRRFGKWAMICGIVMGVVALEIAVAAVSRLGSRGGPPSAAAGSDEWARYYWRKLKTRPSGTGIYGDGMPGEQEIAGLAALGPRARAVVPEMLQEIRNDTRYAPQLARGFAGIGPVTEEVIPSLSVSLDKTAGSTPGAIAWALGEMGPAAAPAGDALVKALSYSDFQVRHEAAFALVKIGARQKEAVPVLLGELQDARLLGRDRDEAAFMLVRCGKEAGAALPVLQACLEAGGPKTELQIYAMVAVAIIQGKPESAVGELIRILDEGGLKSLEVRAAVRALGELGENAGPAIPALVRVFGKAKGDTLRVTIAQTFGKLRTKDPRAIQALKEGLKDYGDQSDYIHRMCQQALDALEKP